jgi:hypothetical protein
MNRRPESSNETVLHVPYLYHDILKLIFPYLSGRDMISCSLVSREWYKTSCDNILWFRILSRELPRFIYRQKGYKDPRFDYDSSICYKLFYLSLFHHQYKFGLIDYFKDIYNTPNEMEMSFEKFGLYIPLTIFAICFFPVAMGIEIYEFSKSHINKYKYCNCIQCFRRTNMLISSIRS